MDTLVEPNGFISVAYTELTYSAAMYRYCHLSHESLSLMGLFIYIPYLRHAHSICSWSVGGNPAYLE